MCCFRVVSLCTTNWTSSHINSTRTCTRGDQSYQIRSCHPRPLGPTTPIPMQPTPLQHSSPQTPQMPPRQQVTSNRVLRVWLLTIFKHRLFSKGIRKQMVGFLSTIGRNFCCLLKQYSILQSCSQGIYNL